jgi:two-component system OmpR family sensor kinase
MLANLSLRARLLLGVVVLAAIGLAAADVATYRSLRSFLIQRTDNSLDAAHVAVEAAEQGPPDDDRHRGTSPGIQTLAAAARGDYLVLLTLSGSVVAEQYISAFGGGSSPPKPRLPHTITLPRTGHPDRVSYFTVSAVSGGSHYRVRASIEPRAPNQILVIAAPLREVDSTLNRLLLIEIAVTLAVLTAIGLLGLWLVRLALKPLDAIGGTAAAIAAGDLSRRVERAEGRTEVGRLGLALNAMLGQIEAATQAREASLRALEESERKLRRFVADASHELRTPLAAVRAYAELFARGAHERPDDLARSMTGIGRESERMTLLVDDLLLLARLDEGRPLDRSPVRLDELASEAVDAAHAVEPGRPIALQTENATVLGDRDRLRQAVDNLLANVRAHTPADTPVRVTLSREDGHARLEVADSGPGMDAEQVAHAFERFYRAEESRTRSSGGVGLGLSIVAAVAQAHGGTVAAASEPGQGATFRIELPLVS